MPLFLSMLADIIMLEAPESINLYFTLYHLEISLIISPNATSLNTNICIYGMNNVIQKELHTLDLAFNYTLDEKWTLSAKADNILNSVTRFTQQINDTGNNIEVERFKTGTGVQIGIHYKF